MKKFVNMFNRKSANKAEVLVTKVQSLDESIAKRARVILSMAGFFNPICKSNAIEAVEQYLTQIVEGTQSRDYVFNKLGHVLDQLNASALHTA